MDDRGMQAVAWGVAAVVAVLLGVRLLGGADPAPAPPVELGAAGAAERRRGGARDRESAGPYVHVAGAVRRPGLYRLPDGARVAAAVRRAGGPSSAADLDLINLAARLQDGQQVVVPRKAAAGHAGDMAAAPPISLGSATVEQLDELDGIGPTLAERIVEHRQARGGFGSLDQLAEVEGIGEQRLEALKAGLTP
ncbi:MAG TPA: helix-hairpin-helix domain-containing protein [Thermoleophilaceae bacterium]|nr:helix-hairpin-helix domain-containing protein [Thermoleophilaceae bacterium]